MDNKVYALMVSGYITALVLLLSLFSIMVGVQESSIKIVGLVAGRNESSIIASCLRAMAEYTDAIIYLDDASSDNTVTLVRGLKKDCRVEKIIEKKVWIRDERADKQALLDAGREIGGTHFILLDADEMFSACCLKNGWLHEKIVAMQPGQIMQFPMVNLWDGVHVYRNDELCNPRSWKWSGITGVFCDDGVCNYKDNPAWGPSGSMHISRAPSNRKKSDRYPQNIKINNIHHNILHYKTVNLDDVIVKKVWYMMLEFIRMQEDIPPMGREECAAKINAFYTNEFANILCDASKITLSSVPDAWIDYHWFDESYVMQGNRFRRNDILMWLQKYGKDYFEGLMVWDVIPQIQQDLI